MNQNTIFFYYLVLDLYVYRHWADLLILEWKKKSWEWQKRNELLKKYDNMDVKLKEKKNAHFPLKEN